MSDGADTNGNGTPGKGKRVRVALEPQLESWVHFYNPTGEESYEPVLNAAQQAFKVIDRIDFEVAHRKRRAVAASEGDVATGAPAAVGDDPNGRDATAGAAAAAASALAPAPQSQDAEEAWAELKEHVRRAANEVEMLYDILTIVGKTGYMRLERVKAEESHSDLRRRLAAQRVQLEGTAALLRASHARIAATVEGERGFYRQLLGLALRWGLRRSGRAVLVDCGYSTVGSTMGYEDTLCELARRGTSTGTGGGGAGDGDGRDGDSCIVVDIPPEFKAVSRVSVSVLATFGEAATGQGSEGLPAPPAHWEDQLRAARNNLFCRELFVQLSREAHAAVGNSASIVSDRRIVAKAGDGRWLRFELCQGPLVAGASSGGGLGDSGAWEAPAGATPGPLPQVMETMLPMLLRLHQRANVHRWRASADPLYAKQAVSVRQRNALETVRAVTRHKAARAAVMAKLDGVAAMLRSRNRLLTLCQHWMATRAMFRSTCLVALECPTLGQRAEFHLAIQDTQVVVTSSDFRRPGVVLSKDGPDLHRFFTTKAAEQIHSMITAAARCLGLVVERERAEMGGRLPLATRLQDTRHPERVLLVESTCPEGSDLASRLTLSADGGRSTGATRWAELRGGSAVVRLHLLFGRLGPDTRGP